MMDGLEFKKLDCGVIVICISENGVVEDLEDIKDEIENGISDVLDDIVDRRNSVVKFKVNIMPCSSGGGDISKN